MLSLIILSALVGLALIGLYRLEERLGLGPLFAFVIACQAFQTFLVSTVSMNLLGRFPTSPGSSVLQSASLFAILLIYLKEGVGATRRLVYAILLANVTLILLTMSTQWGLVSGRLQSLSPVSELFQLFDLKGFVVGTILITVDALLLLAIHEILAARARWLPAAGRIAFSFLPVLCFDTVVFVTVGLGEGPGALLMGNLLGRLLAGSVFAVVLAGFLFSGVDEGKIETAKIRDPLAMFTQRERYLLLQRDKQRSEANLRRLFESNVVGMQTGTTDGRILSANDRFLEMIGYSQDDLPLRWDQLTPPEWRAVDQAKTEEVLETGGAEFWEKEYTHRDGHRVPALVAVTLMEGAETECLAVVVDLTETRQAERALRRSQQRYKSLFEEIPLMYFSLDNDGVVRSVNSKGAAELGYQSEELIGRSVLEIFHPADQSAVSQSLETALANPDQIERREFRKIRRDGTILNVQEAMRVVRTPDGATELLVVCEDITARKEAEDQLLQHQEVLRDLTWSLASVEERERRRIGRELHDGVGQNLAVAQLKLGQVLDQDPSAEIASLTSQTRDLVVETLQATRLLTFVLSSPVLYELGLNAALEAFSEITERDTGLEISVEASGSSVQFSDERATVLYRTTQELVRNVVKHAQAETLRIEVETLPELTRITVEDDGVGFDASEVGRGFSREGGFGLFSVREQMNRLGGDLIVESEPGEGTRVVITALADAKGTRGKRGNSEGRGLEHENARSSC
ncbi:MAG: PAS domain S-box protein [Acidobacteriota bacterium]|nr:PAS domain S-box protein [Acidobacteriota bacterium]